MPKYKVSIKYWQENAFNELSDIVGKIAERHLVNPKLVSVREMSEIANKIINDYPHFSRPDNYRDDKVVFGSLQRYWSKDKKQFIVTYGMAKGWAYLVIEKNKKPNKE